MDETVLKAAQMKAIAFQQSEIQLAAYQKIAAFHTKKENGGAKRKHSLFLCENYSPMAVIFSICCFDLLRG
jgi:hypothetical protein